MKYLIVYGTGEGQTRKIARFIETVLDESGHQATIADATEEPPGPDAYEAIIIGSSIHTNSYHNAVKQYILQHSAALNHKKSAFFSVGMAMASHIAEEQEEVYSMTGKFLEQTGWKPDKIWYLAGALRFTKYDYFKRLVMRLMAKRQGITVDTASDYEYTNWDELKASIADFEISGTD
ncbi:flavodoxin domain-containing protein [Robertkochia flava]|uniref:flavodoxin domain-containing protein n=1 Tax=Robertkochia flava TaxID=3447986 RepID=UPI001CCEABE0|nr:flavodoxin domain-containing protein [Robertkochia marina]